MTSSRKLAAGWIPIGASRTSMSENPDMEHLVFDILVKAAVAKATAAFMFLREALLAVREGPAGDRRDEHDFVTVFEGMRVPAEEADVFVVDVDVDEAA